MSSPERCFEDKQGYDLSCKPQAIDGKERPRKKSVQNVGEASKTIVQLVLVLAAIVLGVCSIINALNGTQYEKIIDPDVFQDYRNHKHSANFTFHEPSSFNFIQRGNDNARYNRMQCVDLKGQVNIRQSIDPTAISVHLDFFASDALLIHPQLLVATDSALTINCPLLLDTSRKETYMLINATIWIPIDMTMDTLGISTESLSINFNSNLKYTIHHRTNISSQSGHITAPFSSLSSDSKFAVFKSRETIIDAGSGSIQGTYSLDDLLSISSSSGSINTNIEPKEASSSSPKPARLRITTNSGSITARTPFLSADLPNRTYETDINSNSGSIDATLVHGKRTSMQTYSGQITTSLSPYSPGSSRSDLNVHTKSGSIDVSLESALADPTSPMRKLYSSYRAGSASLRLRYPKQWEGIVEGKTTTGSMHIDWDGLKLVRDEKSTVGRSIKGVKGEGEGLSTFQIGSGSVDLSG